MVAPASYILPENRSPPLRRVSTMLIPTLVALLYGSVLAASALPEPIRARREMEYSPYAFHAINQVPISVSDYTSDALENLEIIGEDSKPKDKTIYQILNAVPQQVPLHVFPSTTDEHK
jgi:hypothetical protein